MDELRTRVDEYLSSSEPDRPKTARLVYDLWMEVNRLRTMLHTLGVDHSVKETEDVSNQK